MAVDFDPRRTAAMFAVVGLILGGLGTYQALTGERSGNTPEFDPVGTHVNSVSISRDSSPKEFRKTNNLYWAVGVFGFGVGAIGIYYFVKLGDSD